MVFPFIGFGEAHACSGEGDNIYASRSGISLVHCRMFVIISTESLRCFVFVVG